MKLVVIIVAIIAGLFLARFLLINVNEESEEDYWGIM